MKSVWPKYKTPIILATIGALFHIIFVAYPIVASGFNGEGIGLWVALTDLPLVVIEKTLDFHFSHTIDILYYSIGGTLMYALTGWAIGWVWDYLGRLPQKS